MPEALSSFLISVSCILAIALLIPCIESVTKLMRRSAQQPEKPVEAETVKAYSRKVA